MERTSKDLLQLEHKDTSTSSLESALLFCKQAANPENRKPRREGEPLTSPLPQSQLLGRVKDFLGVMSEANERLELEAKDNSKNYDIETLTGDESQVIEMDLMLGVADLHTPEAILAAESAISGVHPMIPVAASSSGTESDESSEDDVDSADEGSSDDVSDISKQSDGKKEQPVNETSNIGDSVSLEYKGKHRSKNRPKIVELSRTSQS